MIDAKPTHLWLRLTPDRLVIGLLGWVGFLFLSERFRWFAFNEKKGWTVLIAVASVGVALLLMALWFAASLLFRWRFQFSIRSLLVLVVVVAIPCSWLAAEMRQADAQRRVIEEWEKMWGHVDYGYMDKSGYLIMNVPQAPMWLRNLLGDDFFSSVWSMRSMTTTDTMLEKLKGLSQLHMLDLTFSADVSDAGLATVKDLTQLQELFLEMTKVTDAGLDHLKGLTQLRRLSLTDTQVTDAGLGHLKGLTRLKDLWLGGTRVTDAGVAKITVAGPEHFTGLTQLEMLMLNDTRVTDAGLEPIREPQRSVMRR